MSARKQIHAPSSVPDIKKELLRGQVNLQAYLLRSDHLLYPDIAKDHPRGEKNIWN